MKKWLSYIIVICVLMSLCANCFAQSPNTYEPVKACKDWKDIVQVGLGQDYVVGLKTDGTVVTYGDVPQWAHIRTWKDITQIEIGLSGTFIAGLKKDGTVIVSYTNDPSYGAFPAEEVETWKGISKISAGYYNTLSGISKGDSIVNEVSEEDWNTAKHFQYNYAKEIHYGGVWLSVMNSNNTAAMFYDGSAGDTYSDVAEVCGVFDPVILHTDGTIELRHTYSEEKDECESWKNVKHIAASGSGYTETYIAAIDKSGNLLLNDDAKGKFGELKVSEASSVEISSNSLAVLMKNGTVNLYTDIAPKTEWDDVADCESWDNITEIAGSEALVAGLKSDGTVELCGNVPEGIDVSGWKDIKQIVCGWPAVFIAGLCSNGTVKVTYPDYIDEKVFPLNEADKWKNITELSAGFNTLCGLKKDGYEEITAKEYLSDDDPWNTVGYFNYDKIKNVRYGNTWLVITENNNTGTFAADGSIVTKYNNIKAVTGVQEPYYLHTDGTIEARHYTNEEPLLDCESWKKIEKISCECMYNDNLAAINTDGKLLLNENAKTTFGDINLTDVKSVYSGDNYLAVVMKNGSVGLYKANINSVEGTWVGENNANGKQLTETLIVYSNGKYMLTMMSGNEVVKKYNNKYTFDGLDLKLVTDEKNKTYLSYNFTDGKLYNGDWVLKREQ